MDVSLPVPGDFRFQDGPVPVVIEVSGRIRDVHVSEGSTVHVGDVLVQLDNTELLLRKSFLESQIHSAELHAAELHLDLLNLYRELRQLQMDLDRLTITSPTDGEIVSLEALHRGEAIQAGTAIAIIYPRKNESAGGLASGAFRTR
jgi:multidrug resistance efflux pump